MTPLIIAATAGIVLLAGIGAACWAWSAWLALQRERAGMTAADAPDPAPATRIEMAALRDRVRRLEKIAQGVDP